MSGVAAKNQRGMRRDQCCFDRLSCNLCQQQQGNGGCIGNWLIIEIDELLQTMPPLLSGNSMFIMVAVEMFCQATGITRFCFIIIAEAEGFDPARLVGCESQ